MEDTKRYLYELDGNLLGLKDGEFLTIKDKETSDRLDVIEHKIVKYYDNPQDYYDLPVEEREAMDELVILNENDNPLSADLIQYDNGSVADGMHKIEQALSVKNITPWFQPAAVVYSNVFQSYQIGNLLIVNASVYFNQGGNLSFATLPVSPKNSNVHFIMYATDGSGYCYCEFNTDGLLTIYGAQANKWYAIEINTIV